MKYRVLIFALVVVGIVGCQGVESLTSIDFKGRYVYDSDNTTRIVLDSMGVDMDSIKYLPTSEVFTVVFLTGALEKYKSEFEISSDSIMGFNKKMGEKKEAFKYKIKGIVKDTMRFSKEGAYLVASDSLYSFYNPSDDSKETMNIYFKRVNGN